PIPGQPAQMDEELDAVQAAQRGRPYQRIDLPLRRDPAHDRQMIARLPLADDRRLALRAIGLHDPGQQVEPRFVREDEGPALAPRLLPQRRPRLGPPALDGLLVALDGPGDGDLRGPVQSLEEARHLTAAVPDVEFLPEDAGDPITGPDLAREAVGLGARRGEAVGLGAVPEEVGEQAELLGSELGASAGARTSAQGLALPGPRGGQPLADGTFGGAEDGGDLALRTALLLEIQGPHPPP